MNMVEHDKIPIDIMTFFLVNYQTIYKPRHSC